MTATPTVTDVEPRFFGASREPLYGCFHAPRPATTALTSAPTPGTPATTGVLLCPPIGHEYVRAHRALRQLAERLARCGMPVLRFDFFGEGDSAGDFEDGSVARWVDDVSLALDELRERGGVSVTAVVGLRLGATLAAMSASDRGDVDTLVLWDPVERGTVFLEETAREHARVVELYEMAGAAPNITDTPDDDVERVGYVLTPELREDLEAIDLSAIGERPADRVAIVDSHDAPAYDALRASLPHTGARVEHLHQPGPRIWQQEVYEAMVPSATLDRIVEWIGGAHR